MNNEYFLELIKKINENSPGARRAYRIIWKQIEVERILDDEPKNIRIIQSTNEDYDQHIQNYRDYFWSDGRKRTAICDFLIQQTKMRELDAEAWRKALVRASNMVYLCHQFLATDDQETHENIRIWILNDLGEEFNQFLKSKQATEPLIKDAFNDAVVKFLEKWQPKKDDPTNPFTVWAYIQKITFRNLKKMKESHQNEKSLDDLSKREENKLQVQPDHSITPSLNHLSMLLKKGLWPQSLEDVFPVIKTPLIVKAFIELDDFCRKVLFKHLLWTKGDKGEDSFQKFLDIPDFEPFYTELEFLKNAYMNLKKTGKSLAQFFKELIGAGESKVLKNKLPCLKKLIEIIKKFL